MSSVRSSSSAAILGCAGAELSRDEAAFFREVDPFGFILFARNVETPDQLRRLCADLREAVGREAVITIDQEGGRVQRLRAPHWREHLPPLEQVRAAGADAARSLWLSARLIAAELYSLGIDSNCAPCADVAGAQTHPFLRNRCLGESADEVARNARAVSEGLLAGGVLPVVKHMPGHGRALVDSHKSLPRAEVSRAEAYAQDFAPFKALADLPFGMTAHIVFPEWGEAPATQNPDLISLLRRELGFQGLLMTDDLNMEALEGDLGQRTRLAMQAGCDLALHCSGERGEMEAVLREAGALSEGALQRAERALSFRHPPQPVDIEALEAELQQILQGAPHAD